MHSTMFKTLLWIVFGNGISKSTNKAMAPMMMIGYGVLSKRGELMRNL